MRHVWVNFIKNLTQRRSCIFNKKIEKMFIKIQNFLEVIESEFYKNSRVILRNGNWLRHIEFHSLFCCWGSFWVKFQSEFTDISQLTILKVDKIQEFDFWTYFTILSNKDSKNIAVAYPVLLHVTATARNVQVISTGKKRTNELEYSCWVATVKDKEAENFKCSERKNMLNAVSYSIDEIRLMKLSIQTIRRH